MNPRLVILGSAFFFGLMGFLTKLATATIPGGQAMLFRSVFVTIAIVIPWLLRIIPIQFVNLQLLGVRALFGGAAATFYFLSLQHIPLGAAIVLNHTAPIFATLYEGLFFQERFKTSTVIALAISFVGVLMIFYGDFGTFRIGYLYGLLCGILGGGAITSIRELRKTDSTSAIVLAFSLASIVFSLPPAVAKLGISHPFHWTPREWLLLAALSASGLAAQWLFTYAGKFLRASEAGTLGITTVVIATILGIIFLHESFTIAFVAGAVLILGSALFLSKLFPLSSEPRIEPQ